MDVIFERTGWRSYAVEVFRADASALRMDPAPGFDKWFPHDLQHLIVEEQLGLTRGIYGRLAAGGTASTFDPQSQGAPAEKRSAARQRRKATRRDTSLAADGPNDFDRSERATYVAWQSWLSYSALPELRTRADTMAADAESILSRMARGERDALIAVLPALRERITQVATEWSETEIGGSMTVEWKPLAAS